MSGEAHGVEKAPPEESCTIEDSSLTKPPRESLTTESMTGSVTSSYFHDNAPVAAADLPLAMTLVLQWVEWVVVRCFDHCH